MPLTEPLRRRLEAARDWLSSQPLFQPAWNNGCSAVACYLDRWVEGYAKEILGPAATEPIKERSSLRMWSAWAYHWEQASRHSPTKQADGVAVASAVRAGNSPGRSHPMGGDPFRDSVLVEGCLAGANPALDRFYREYQVVFDQEVRRAFHREPDSALWEDVFVKLVGPSPGGGRLGGFVGYSSLRSWLRPVTRHYALDHYRLEQIRRVAEQRAALLHPTQTASPDPVEWDETLDWCRAEVVRALNTLEHRDRLLLLLRYRSGWPGHAIAAALRVHPGHFSRLLEQATERLRLHLERPWEKLFQEYDTATVAYLLFRGLDEAHAEEPELDAHRPPGAEEPAMSTTEKRKKPADPKKTARTRGKSLVHKKLADLKKAAAAKGAQKAAPKKVAPTKAPPAKQARTPSPVPPEAEHPLPDVGPEELELFLPERVATAKIGDSPEDLFAQLEGQSPEERAAVVCLDVREEQDLDAVFAWLKKFDAVAAEQYEDDTEAPYEPHRVVFLSEAAPEVPDEWSTRADLDWVRTEDKTGDILPLYRRYLQDDLRDFVSGDLEDFFPKPPVGEAERLVDRIPTAKQEAWKARVQMFQERDDEA